MPDATQAIANWPWLGQYGLMQELSNKSSKAAWATCSEEIPAVHIGPVWYNNLTKQHIQYHVASLGSPLEC